MKTSMIGKAVAGALATGLLWAAPGYVVAQTTGTAATADAKTFSTALERRKAAAQQLKDALAASGREVPALPTAGGATRPAGTNPSGINPAVDITKANFAYSPNLRKFVDSMPGVGKYNASNLNAQGVPLANKPSEYIPLAVPDTTTFPAQGAIPASHFYKLGIATYRQQMHTDLPAAGTELRGYYQKNAPAGDPLGSGAQKYLGPLILALRDTPVRFQVFNEKPLGAAGNLLLPVDTLLMGAGMGPSIQDINSTYNATTGAYSMPCDPMAVTTCATYTQNRSAIHLHGGWTPWISDGTPHQWFTPANEDTPFKKGAAFAHVPDMYDGYGGATPKFGMSSPGDGIGTYYYPNQQSGRLLFYHDHSLGLTRLNVYAGEAAGYLLIDPVEIDLINGTNYSQVFGNFPTSSCTAVSCPKVLPDQTYLANSTVKRVDQTPTDALPSAFAPALKDRNQAGVGGGLYNFGIPLVIQDKTFVNDVSTRVNEALVQALINPATASGYSPTPLVDVSDPLWKVHVAGAAGSSDQGGRFWFPHEYLPNENIYDPLGYNVKGRWDYAPMMNPPMPALVDILPSPTVIPEAYGDTLIVNGIAFPYLAVPRAPLRFRVLNASNDRFVNLQLYYAKQPDTVALNGNNLVITPGRICDGTGSPIDPATCTEVSIVPASPNATYPNWPVDGREGGVPDPTTMGPEWIWIGNEAGLLAKPSYTPAQPIDFDYNRRSVTFGGVTSKSLLVFSAMRADVIVDFGTVADGAVLMLYNDAPAPMPLFDSRYDIFTDGPDQTDVGGAPTIPPGFGPNTRTIMQFRVNGQTATTFNKTLLNTWLPKAFAKTQHRPLVPAKAYQAAYPGDMPDIDVYSNNRDETLNITGTPTPLAQVVTVAPGAGYTAAPTVSFAGGDCTISPTATAGLNGVTAITLTAGGKGYTTTPTVTIGAPPAGGIRATATATVSGGVVTVITITNMGSGYTAAPAITISAPPAGAGNATATATATVQRGTVGAITFINPGMCSKAPYVTLVTKSNNPGTGAVAAAMLKGDMVMNYKNLVEGFDPDFGRMNASLGSTPNPLAPTVGAGPVIGIAQYIDPPTEVMRDEESVLWRIQHIGVDSHAIHFHLFDVQVVNRVDWTNTIKPPYEEELGWKDTIRTNPFEDIIVALRPARMTLPFTIPNSKRLLDPTMPVGSIGNFLPVAPPPGLPAIAQTTNVMTDYGWEYVWHCHLLGHEENDMMRPISMLAGGTPTLKIASSPTGATITGLTFGSQTVGTTSAPQTATLIVGVRTMHITNWVIGGSSPPAPTDFPADFKIDPATTTCGKPGAVYGPDGTCNIGVQFTPGAASTTNGRTATLTITNDSTTPSAVIKLAGTGANATGTNPALTAISGVNFANVNLGSTSGVKTFTFSAGSTNLTNVSVALSSTPATVAADYKQTNNCGTSLLANKACTISVTFTPTAVGTRGPITLTVSSNKPAVKINTITGTGYGPVASISPSSLGFGNEPVNVASPKQSVYLMNTGTAPLSILANGIYFDGLNASDFTQTNACNGTVAANNGICQIDVVFRPTGTGGRAANLVVKTDSYYAPVAKGVMTVALSGTGVAYPVAQLTPTNVLSFGSVARNGTSVKSVTVKNVGSAGLKIFGTVLDGAEFVVDDSACVAASPLDAGASCSISVTFKPVNPAGTKVGTLTINDDSGNDQAATQMITLTGNAQ